MFWVALCEHVSYCNIVSTQIGDDMTVALARPVLLCKRSLKMVLEHPGPPWTADSLCFRLQRAPKKLSPILTRFTASVAIPKMAAPPTPRTNRALDSRKSITTAIPSSPRRRVFWKFITSSLWSAWRRHRRNAMIEICVNAAVHVLFYQLQSVIQNKCM